MATLTITGVGPLYGAEIPLPAAGRITLVAGLNQAGKSTVCRAAAAVGTRAPKLLGANKADRAALLPHGVVSGAVALEDQTGGSYRVDLPSGEAVERGSTAGLPRLSRVAAGLDRPSRMPAKERAALLVTALEAEPSAEDWIRACATSKLRLPPDQVAGAWKIIESDDWDSAAQRLADRAKAKKGAWCQVTGARAFAGVEGAKWQPEGPTEDLMTLDLEALRGQLVAARSARDEIVAQGAVTQDQRAKLERKTQGRAGVEADLEKARPAQATAAERLRAAQAELETTPRPGGVPCECPHCAKPVTIHDGNTLRKAASDKAGYLAWTKIEEAARHARASHDGATARVTQLEKRLADMDEAAAELAKLPAPDTADRLAAADREIERIEALGRAAKQTREARALHAEVLVLLALAELAGPTGCRKDKLAKAVGALNEELAELSAAFGVEPIGLTDDLTVARGRLPYDLLSESAQWRADAILAVALARRDGSSFVVLDRADVLDLPGRKGLVAMLVESGVGALVAMTVNRPDLVPALGGHEVWLERGTARAVEEVLSEGEKAA